MFQRENEHKQTHTNAHAHIHIRRLIKVRRGKIRYDSDTVIWRCIAITPKARVGMAARLDPHRTSMGVK